MDIMDTEIIHLVQKVRAANEEIQQGEDDVELIRKVINLNSKHKEVVNKLLEASDQCKDIIGLVLSSANPVLDLVQKIVRANTEEYNLLRRLTELGGREWELVRKFIYLCNGEKYFIFKFMDWYLRDERFGFPCSCSTRKEVEHNSEDRMCNEKMCDGTAGEVRTMVSSYASQGESGEKFIANVTKQGISRGELNDYHGENGFSLDKAEVCTENRNVTNKTDCTVGVHFTEKLESSVECRSEEEAHPSQPDMMYCGQLLSDSCKSSEDFCGGPVSHIGKNNDVFQVKATEQLDVINAQKIKAVHGEVLIKENSTPAVNENIMEINISHNKTKIENSLLNASENVSTVSGDKTDRGEAHFSGKEIEKIMSGTHDSSLTVKKVDSVTMNTYVQVKPLPPQTKVEEGKRTFPDNSTETEVPCNPDNVEKNNEHPSETSSDKTERIDDHLCIKERKKIISDTYESSLIVKRSKNSVPDKSCHVQLEIENEDGKSNDHGQEPLQTELKNDKTTFPDNITEKEALFPPKNVKVNNKSLSTVSGEKVEEVDVHLSGKNGEKNISDTHSSFFTEKNVSWKNFAQPEPLPSQTKVGKGERTFPDNTEKEAAFYPENVEVNNENLCTLPGDKTVKVDACMCDKDSKEISAGHDSVFTAKNITNSVSEENSVQPEIESECARLNGNRWEPSIHLSKLEGSDRTVLDNGTEKETPFLPEYVEVNSDHLKTISQDKLEKVDAHVSGMESRKVITATHDSFLTAKKATNSIAEEICPVQPEVESLDAKSNYCGQELLPFHMKLRKGERTFPSITAKEVPFPPEYVKVNNVNLSTVSREKVEKVGAHLSGKERKKIISDTHDSFLTVKNVTNSVSVRQCYVQLEPLPLQTKVEEGERAFPDNSTENGASFHPEIMKGNSENHCTLSEDKMEKVEVHPYGKDSNEISAVHDSFSTEKSITESVREKNCSVQPEIENECARSNGSGQTPAPLLSNLKESERTILDNSIERKISFLSGNEKMNSENQNKISQDKTDKICGNLSGKKNKRTISNAHDSFLTARRNTNTVSKKSFSARPEVEGEYARPNDNVHKYLRLDSELKDSKRRADNSTEKETSYLQANVKVNNKARTCRKIKSKGESSYITWDNKCEEECNVIAGHSVAKETYVVSPSDSREIIQPTDEVKSSVSIKHEGTKLCMKKMGFLTAGVNMFTIATSMTQLLHAGEKNRTSPELLKKAESFFTVARSIYSSLEKYLRKMQKNEKNGKHEELSNCACRMLQCMLKLQSSISLRYAPAGKNMKVLIKDITRVMDVITEVITIATKEEKGEMQAQKLDEEKTPSKQFHLRNMTSMDKKKEVATSNLCTKPNIGFVPKDCYIRLVDIMLMLKGKKTVNLKDLKESQEARMEKSITEIKTLNITDCGIKQINNTPLNMKRKRDTKQKDYGNNARKRIATSEDHASKAHQRHKPVECTTNEVNIPTDHDLSESATKQNQDSANSECLQYSSKGIQVHTSHEPQESSTNGVQVPITNELTEYSTNGHVPICYESIQCSVNGLQTPVNHEQTELSTNEPQVHIKQETNDFETSHSNAGAEDLDVCEDTFRDWQDVIVKEELTVEEHPIFEEMEFGQEVMMCSASSVNTANTKCQILNSEELSNASVYIKDVPEYTHFGGIYTQFQHGVPEIQNQELMYSEEGSCGDTSGETVEQRSSMRLRMKPEFSKQTDLVLKSPLFGAAAEIVSDMEKALGIHIPPISLGQVGSLKWTQYTTGIDHPYSCETEKPTVKKCSKYICEICGKVIHSACNLNRHVKSHFRFTDVMCSCCGKCIGNFQCWTEHKQNCTAANNIL